MDLDDKGPLRPLFLNNSHLSPQNSCLEDLAQESRFPISPLLRTNVPLSCLGDTILVMDMDFGAEWTPKMEVVSKLSKLEPLTRRNVMPCRAVFRLSSSAHHPLLLRIIAHLNRAHDGYYCALPAQSHLILPTIYKPDANPSSISQLRLREVK